MAATTTTKRRKRRGKGNLLSGFDASVEEQSALDQYLRDVSRHELITPDREKELGARAQKGDQEAIQERAPICASSSASRRSTRTAACPSRISSRRGTSGS
jgi:DNA-directed RNA polymerase sigma subunit (sigma70/sigma32)